MAKDSPREISYHFAIYSLVGATVKRWQEDPVGSFKEWESIILDGNDGLLNAELPELEEAWFNTYGEQVKIVNETDSI